MSWEALPQRVRQSQSVWGISINKAGAVSIWIPREHPLCQSRAVTTEIGKKEHEGWIRLLPSATGRVFYKTNRNSSSRWCLKYSTLPGAPNKLNMTELTVRNDGANAVMVKLPWEPKQGYSIGSERR